MKKTICTAIYAMILCFSICGSAEETNLEKAETGMNKSVDQMKKTSRGAKDKTCEMVNGKMHCMGQKAKHKMKNMSDKIDTDVKEIKNKAD
ncbi:MAG: hypothetical protein ACOYOK_02330 [Pseudobdellovibrionaceae bacterium]